MSRDQQDIEIEVSVRHETDSAILVYDGKVEAWIPKSRISDQSEAQDGTIETIFIPEWFALEKGLI